MYFDPSLTIGDVVTVILVIVLVVSLARLEGRFRK